MNNTKQTRNLKHETNTELKIPNRHGRRIWFYLLPFYLSTFLPFLFAGCSFDYYFNKAVNAKKPSEKIKLFSMALKKWKDTDGEKNKTNTYINRGASYGMLNIYDLAKNDFDEAIKYNTNDSELYHNRAIIYYRMGNVKQALTDVNLAIKLNPSFKEGYILRSGIYKKIGDKKKSESDLAMANKLLIVDNYYEQGLAFFKAKDHNTAIKYFTNSIRANPKNPEVYNVRGLAYIYAGKTKQAISDFNEAIKINPNFVDAYNNRATIYAQDKSKIKEAVCDLKKVIQLKKSDPQAYYNLGLLSNNDGNFDTAINYFDMADKLSKSMPNPDLYYQRGLSYFNKKIYQQAVADFSKTIKIASDNADAYRFRGLCWEKLGNMKKANEDLICAVKLNANFAK